MTRNNTSPPASVVPGPPGPNRSFRTSLKQNVPAARTQIGKVMNDEMTVTKTFKKFKPLLPSSFDTSPSRILEAEQLLRDEGLLHKTASGWTWFHGEGQREDKAFAGLQKLFDTLADRKFDGKATRVKYGSLPYSETHSDINGGSHRIDAFLALRQPELKHGEKPHTANLGVNLELKPEEGLGMIVDNRLKAVSAATFMMNNDARRTHVYSLTIEKRRLSVWYFTRSHSAKSAVIDMTKNFHDVLVVFLSLLYADLEELGYDPSVLRRVDLSRKVGADGHHPMVFVYKVDGRHFKTVRALSDYVSLCITGRATRIWEVLEVKDLDTLIPMDNSHTMVLKDYWLDIGMNSEGCIHAQVLADLSAVAAIVHPTQVLNAVTTPAAPAATSLEASSRCSSMPTTASNSVAPRQFTEDEKGEIVKCVNDFGDAGLIDSLKSSDAYKKHFLSVVCEQEGIQSKSVADESFRVSEFFKMPGASEKKASVPGVDSTRSEAVTAGAQAEPEQPQILERTFTPKRRRFVVYQEVGKTLHNLTELSDAMNTISGCLRASQLLFLAGWVHRDISGGNLILHDGRGILSDLEYARRYTNTLEASKDPKTGTPYFMATEIQNNRPHRSPEDDPDDDSVNSRDNASTVGVQSAGIVHNYAHDVESFWWLILWISTARVRHTESEKYASNLFMSAVGRFMAFTVPRQLLDDLNGGAIHLHLQPIVGLLNSARKTLLSSHQKRAGNIGGLSYVTKTSYINDFKAVRGLIDLVISKVLQPRSSDSDSPIHDLKSYRAEVKWVDDHRPIAEVLKDATGKTVKTMANAEGDNAPGDTPHALGAEKPDHPTGECTDALNNPVQSVGRDGPPARVRKPTTRKRARSTSAEDSQPRTSARMTRSQTSRISVTASQGGASEPTTASVAHPTLITQKQAEPDTVSIPNPSPGVHTADTPPQAEPGAPSAGVSDLSTPSLDSATARLATPAAASINAPSFDANIPMPVIPAADFYGPPSRSGSSSRP